VPGLLSRFLRTPEARRKLRYVTAGVFGLVALVGWWSVMDEGASPARVLAAAASTVVALIEIFLPKRRRLLNRVKSD
jgi:putative flippase GtrA